MITTTYYIGAVKCHQIKAYNGGVLTEDGHDVWLGEREGYPACGSKAHAKRFKTAKEVAAYALRSDGMPWYFRFKEGSLRIVKITETKVLEVTEEEM